MVGLTPAIAISICTDIGVLPHNDGTQKLISIDILLFMNQTILIFEDDDTI